MSRDVQSRPQSRPTSGELQTSGGLLLTEVAAAARLQEGPEGVRRLLCAVFRDGPLPLRDLARSARLPVPVAAAVRRELEKRHLLQRSGGVALSRRGADFVASCLGLRTTASFAAESLGRPSVPEPLRSLLAPLVSHLARRPSPDRSLDQSHGTPETALRRALYMHQQDALEGRHVLMLGDDDLVSVAAALLLQELRTRAASLCVVDVDPRVLACISDLASAERWPITCWRHDLRRPLPPALVRRFDTFVTDPPYTASGVGLFVSRGVEALRREPGKQGFLSCAHKAGDTMVAVLERLIRMGLHMDEIIPCFNDYEGAAILANSSQMIHLRTTSLTRPAVTGRFEAAIYTGSASPGPVRRCVRCGRRIPGAPRGVTHPEAQGSERVCPRCERRRPGPAR